MSRDLFADEARNAAAMVCAAAQVMNEVYSTDEGFLEARDSMVSEYRLQMVGQ